MNESVSAVPEGVAFLLLAGAVALAVWNLGKLAQLLRLDKALSWLARTLTAPISESVNTHLALQVERVLYEVQPNGGKSAHDKLAREIREGVSSLRERIDAHAAYSAEDREVLHARTAEMDEEIMEIRASLDRLETGETPPDDEAN